MYFDVAVTISILLLILEIYLLLDIEHPTFSGFIKFSEMKESDLGKLNCASQNATQVLCTFPWNSVLNQRPTFTPKRI